ncbi:MAG TPA: maleylpyruvate isomerase family mycothiol-dependent enzyme, partial [Actinomycetes bacterium]
MPSIARAERAALSDLLESLGPDAPTLCEGWDTRDLAAHLVVRERRMDAAPGIVLRPLAGHLESVTR